MTAGAVALVCSILLVAAIAWSGSLIATARLDSLDPEAYLAHMLDARSRTSGSAAHHLRGLSDCVAILSPDFPANAPANEQRLDAQVEWFARVFGDRAWVALTLDARAMDDIQYSAHSISRVSRQCEALRQPSNDRRL
ncbi:hypothetical protein WS89_02545 [Burkholderia sp. MSMB1072]|nr:hypothetical protein WS89_02545 [Burkholderia sp. MSMB1072]